MSSSIAVQSTADETHSPNHAGHHARLEMRLSGTGDRTRIVHLSARPPLLVQRPLYLDDERPALAHIFLVSVGPGMLQGDHWMVDIRAEAGANVHITTQAATKIHRASVAQGNAQFELDLAAVDGSFLEFWPDPVILFAGSRFLQRVRLTTCPASTILYCEILVPGRLARGEAFLFDAFDSEIAGHRLDGTLLFGDRQRIQHCNKPPTYRGLFGAYPVLGSIYLLRPDQPDPALAPAITDRLADIQDMLGGASELPHSAGLVVRVLGRTAGTVSKGLEDARALIHATSFGVAVKRSRKY